MDSPHEDTAGIAGPGNASSGGSRRSPVSAGRGRGGISAIPNRGVRGGCQSLDIRGSDYGREPLLTISTGP